MYNSQRNRKIFLFFVMITLLFPCQIFGFDLAKEITDKIDDILGGESVRNHMARSYYSNFPKDPFGDAMSDITAVLNKTKKAGEEYIKNSLNFEGCSISNKEIRGILYYYFTGFRADVARSLKIENGNYDASKYEIDEETVVDYCNKIFSGCVKKGPTNMETNCKEFFEKNYRAGEYNEQMKQNVESSWLGSDKYWNKSSDDSPYDIMEDLAILSKLLYMDAQDPITPVFYKVPSFSNLKNIVSDDGNDIQDSEDGNESSDDGGTNGDYIEGGDVKNPNGEGYSHNPLLNDDGGKEGGLLEKPVSPLDFENKNDYDDLLEGLGAYKLTNNGSEFYSNLCDDAEESELDENLDKSENYVEVGGDFGGYSEEELEEFINQMLESVDKYTSLSEEKEKEVEEKAGNKDEYVSDLDSQYERTAEQIKNCWKSCDGLRVDQKASCMVKCACGEIKSKWFDPSEFPGLGPIFVLRFCAVPGVDNRFSVGGKRIHSIEEGLREIYGVVDKLSREGRLSTWTQQYEFLDSSTKRINFANTFAFTIGVEIVDTTNKIPKHSAQYQEMELKNYNKNAQVHFGISNELTTSKGKDYYKIIGSNEKSENDLTDSSDELSQGSSFVSENPNEDANAQRHVDIESYWSLWWDQQGELWINSTNYIKSLIEAATDLDNKNKCS